MIRRLQHALVASWLLFLALAIVNAIAVTVGLYGTVCGVR
jgi:hypothetical protein